MSMGEAMDRRFLMNENRDLRAELERAQAALADVQLMNGTLRHKIRTDGRRAARLRSALSEIAYTMPVSERNPDGDEQAAYSMRLAARDALVRDRALRPLALS